MNDHATQQRQEWLRAGAPGVRPVPPIFQRDERGRPVFRYVHSSRTDVAATFARVKRSLAKQ